MQTNFELAGALGAGPIHVVSPMAVVIARAAEAALSDGRIAQAEKLGRLAAELLERSAR
jgi:hypothetical protein